MGKPRKSGRRLADGRLSRAKDDRYDHGTDCARKKRAAYGTDGCDAIGRAYRSGLLGEDGQRLLQTGRSINRAYWAAYGQYGLTSALGNRVGGPDDDGNSLAREKWLNATLREIDSMGRDHRKAFDELCLDFHPDYGPRWLDNIISCRHDAPRSDWSRLAKALEVLEELSDGW
jgi:hypothetical protein